MAVATGKSVNQPAANNALSLVASSFDVSGQFFASVVPSLDLSKIQVSSTGGDITGSSTALNVSLVLEKGVSVSTLAWAYLPETFSSASQSKKKRKRSLDATTPYSLESAVVVLGTNNGDILVYSPVKNSIVFKLQGSHEFPISSIDTSSSKPLTKDAIKASASIWSCDNSGKVVEWDLTTKSALRTFKAAQPDITLVKQFASAASNENKSPLLLASSSIYLIDSNQPANTIKSLPAFASPATQLIPSTSNTDLVFAYSSNERNVSIISISKEKPVALLVAQSNVKKFVLSSDESVAAIVTENGTVEIFNNPLTATTDSSAAAAAATPSKSNRSRKSLAAISLTPTSTIAVTRPAPVTSSKKQLTVKQKAALRVIVEDVSFPANDNYVTLTWIEHGTIPVFEKVEWKNQDGTAKTGDISLVKSVKVLQGLESKNNLNVEGEDVATAKRYTEDTSAVKSGNDLSHLDGGKEVSKNEEEEEDEDEDEDDEESSTLAERLNVLEADEEGKANGTSKSSGGKKNDKSRDISTTLLSKEFDEMSLKTPESFTLVLAQSLKTNDHALLESLLTTHNEENIKVSVKRLESSQAVLLVERLADKISRSPGRAGQLMVWIKWTLIAHGGYLVSVPNLAQSLSSLHLTLSNKVGMLPRLLALQGRVEMLRTQLQMRREITQQMNGSAGARGGAGDDDEDDSDVDSDVDYIEDDNVVIVNGEEDYDNDDDDDDDEDEEEEDEEDEEEDDDEFTKGSDFIELEAEESEGDEDEEEEDDKKAMFAQDGDYDMSDVEAEGVEKLAAPDASDDEMGAGKRSSSKKTVGKRGATKKGSFKKANGASRR